MLLPVTLYISCILCVACWESGKVHSDWYKVTSKVNEMITSIVVFKVLFSERNSLQNIVVQNIITWRKAQKQKWKVIWICAGRGHLQHSGAPFTTRLLTQQKGQPLDLSPPDMPAFCRCVSRTSLSYSLNHLADTNEHRSSALIIGPWQVNIIGISLTKHTPQRHVQLLRLWFSERRLNGC